MDDTAVVLREMIVERQRLLVREANYLRRLVGLPTLDGAEVESDQDDDGSHPPSAHIFDLTLNRRVIVATVAACIVKHEPATYTVLRLRSGVAQKSLARTLTWAVACGVLTRTECGYVPGPAWSACVDSDAELLGLVSPGATPTATPRDTSDTNSAADRLDATTGSAVESSRNAI